MQSCFISQLFSRFSLVHTFSVSYNFISKQFPTVIQSYFVGVGIKATTSRRHWSFQHFYRKRKMSLASVDRCLHIFRHELRINNVNFSLDGVRSASLCRRYFCPVKCFVMHTFFHAQRPETHTRTLIWCVIHTTNESQNAHFRVILLSAIILFRSRFGLIQSLRGNRDEKQMGDKQRSNDACHAKNWMYFAYETN